MKQDELLEISYAFLDAWKEYFGDVMYYVPFISSSGESRGDKLYKETKTKKYDYEHKVKFHGTLKEAPCIDEIEATGLKINKDFEIALITQELVDGGVQYIDTNSLILYIDRFGNEFTYKIYDEYKKVQFSNSKIFTKLRVIPHE